MLNKHIKPLALVWLALNILGLYYITSFHPPQFDGDILNLLKSDDTGATLGRELLQSQAKDIKFGFENMEVGEISKFKKELVEKIPELEEINYLNKEVLKNLVSNLWPYSLDDGTLNLFENGETKNITERIQNFLSGPDSYFYSFFLEADPLLLLTPKLKPMLETLDINSAKNISRYKIKGTQDDKLLVPRIESLIAEQKLSTPQSIIHWSGFIKFKNSSANKIEQDIKLVTTVSAILIPLCLILFFRSIIAPILSIVSGLSGVLFGILLVVATRDSIHLITLAFGSSLVGASIDYAIHYQSEGVSNWKLNQNALRKVAIPALLVGAFTSILSFAGLYVSSFPGLQELAIFSIGSLVASLITTVLWFPYMSFKNTEKRLNSIEGMFGGFDVSKTKSISGLFLGIIILYAGLNYNSDCQLFQDDIGALQSPDKILVDEELWFKGAGSSNEYFSLIFLNTQIEQDEVDNLLKVAKVLNVPPFSILPSKEEALTSKTRITSYLKEFETEVKSELKNIKYDSALIEKIFGQKNTSYQESLNPLLSRFKVNQTYSFLPVDKDISTISNALNNSDLNIVYSLYNHRENISSMFKSFRVESIYVVSISYILIFILLALRYGLVRGLYSLAPSLVSILCSLLILNTLGISLSFFGVLAFVIVLGLSIDYSVFHLEAGEKDLGARLSIFLSTLTTIITFGTLALSQTESLKNFGVVISLGMFFTAIYTNIIFNKLHESNED